MNRKKARPLLANSTLADRIEKLNAKRQEIIRPALENPREYVLLSVRALAQRLKTDPATMVRIVRGLGFASYRDFQRHLHETSLAFATSLDTSQPAGRDGGVTGAIRNSIAQDLKNLQALKNSVDAPRLAGLAERLYAARRIVALGCDLAGTLVEYLRYHISVLGLPIFAGTSPGGISHLVRGLRKDDLLIAISFRRGLRQTVEGASVAKQNGAYCVGIADTFLSPLARKCDELFLASVESTSLGVSYGAPISLANAILAACCEFRRPETQAIAREIAEEQRKGFRRYTT